MNNKRLNDEKNANLRKKTSYVSKLFNIKNDAPTPRQNENIDVNKIRKEVEAEMLEKVETKVSQLESQIALLQKERSKTNVLKSELETRCLKFNEEKMNFNSWKQTQINEFEKWKKEELNKVAKTKKNSDKNIIDLNCALKRSRDENESLREEIRKLISENKDRDVKFKAQNDRKQKQIDNLNQKVQELEQSLKIAQKDEVRGGNVNYKANSQTQREKELNKLIKNPDYDSEIKTKVKESPRSSSTCKTKELKNKSDQNDKENGRNSGKNNNNSNNMNSNNVNLNLNNNSKIPKPGFKKDQTNNNYQQNHNSNQNHNKQLRDITNNQNSNYDDDDLNDCND